VHFHHLQGGTVTEARREWVTPTVQRYGSFDEITQGGISVPCTDKNLGFSDGITLAGTPIGCAEPSGS
jgi:hypothetical protein